MFARPSNSGGITVDADGQSAPQLVHTTLGLAGLAMMS